MKVDWMQILGEYLEKKVVKEPVGEEERKCYRKIMMMDLTGRLAAILFQIVYLVKFGDQRQSDHILGVDLGEVVFKKRGLLGEVYTQLYSQVVSSQYNNAVLSAEVINHLLFSLSYILHMTFFKVFRLDRQHFSLRFILDCYHIVIFEVNGVYVSDYYL